MNWIKLNNLQFSAWKCLNSEFNTSNPYRRATIFTTTAKKTSYQQYTEGCRYNKKGDRFRIKHSSAFFALSFFIHPAFQNVKFYQKQSTLLYWWVWYKCEMLSIRRLHNIIIIDGCSGENVQTISKLI